MKQGKPLLAVMLAILFLSYPFAVAEEISLSYDANGNLLQDEKNLYGYDSLNQLVSVRANTLEQNLLESYVYDDSGKRIKKVSFHTDGSNETMYYINDNFLRVVNSSGTFDTIFYFHNGQRIARKDPDGKLFFYHPDHLGSTDLVTDEDGNKVEKTAYMPFGEVLSGGESRFGFTGKEKDKETGLMYYGARYYSPSFKRFTQPDSVIADIYNPQNLNRYSYVLNNPVKYTDPSGNEFALATVAAVILVAMEIADLFEFGYSVSELSQDPQNQEKQVGTLISFAAVAGGPFIEGTGVAKRIGKNLDIIGKQLDNLVVKPIFKYLDDIQEISAKAKNFRNLNIGTNDIKFFTRNPQGDIHWLPNGIGGKGGFGLQHILEKHFFGGPVQGSKFPRWFTEGNLRDVTTEVIQSGKRGYSNMPGNIVYEAAPRGWDVPVRVVVEEKSGVIISAFPIKDMS